MSKKQASWYKKAKAVEQSTFLKIHEGLNYYTLINNGAEREFTSPSDGAKVAKIDFEAEHLKNIDIEGENTGKLKNVEIGSLSLSMSVVRKLRAYADKHDISTGDLAERILMIQRTGKGKEGTRYPMVKLLTAEEYDKKFPE